MAQFSAKVLGGPSDGDVWHPPFAPRDGDVVPCVHDGMKSVCLYTFDMQRMAWIHTSIVTRSEWEARAKK